MSTSVGMKDKKKQSSLSQRKPVATDSREFESALLALENACFAVMDGQVSPSGRDTEGRYWQQVLKNIANPVSLALMECKGPRHFHYHYRHRPEDETVLHPVLENPVEMLAQVCQEALQQCHRELTGIHDPEIMENQRMLEHALIAFLQRYEATTAK